MPRASWSILAAVAASCFFAAVARADALTAPVAADDPTLRPLVAKRRAGIVFGAAGGIGLAGASGYPNNERLKGNPDFYSESPMLVGWSTSYFVMGALTDYLSFGPMLNIALFEDSEWKSTGFALGFRGEAYPLLRLVPALADTAIYGQLGFGTTELRAKGPYPTAEGSQSFAAIGVHHEWRLVKLLGGHATAGPYAEYDAIRSSSAERHWFSAGLRLAFYGGAVELDRAR